MSSPKSSKSRFQVTQSMPTAKSGTKRSRLRVSYINPMSVIKTTFILSLAFGLASIVALIMLWSVAKFSGTIDAATGLLTDIFGIGGAGFNIVSLLSLPRIIFVEKYHMPPKMIMKKAVMKLSRILFIPYFFTGSL